uniref:Elongation factor Ts, mitochondrial n=1 Tax=Callithamnion tetricum TaxID=193179 RepID=A0A4D6WMU6_9FLOR|nr:Translation elongation factor Ts [Callithamnion tetricum]
MDTISIKELRSKTSAGISDCKKALKASQGDLSKALEFLRKKGLASAEKKTSRIAAEGLIESYIHTGSKLGIIVEINCETDFVAREEKFQVLAKNIAMQLAASTLVEYVSIKDIPEHIKLHEKSIELDKEDIKNKPDNVKDKIVVGRMEKRLKELSLMDQAFIKDSSISIEDLIKQHISILGENIQVRRFERFILGQGLNKKSNNLAEEISEIISHSN